MAGWTLTGRSLGGRGVSRPLPPTLISVSLPGGYDILSSSWLLSSEAHGGQIPGIMPSLAQAREIIHWSSCVLRGLRRRNRLQHQHGPGGFLWKPVEHLNIMTLSNLTMPTWISETSMLTIVLYRVQPTNALP